MNCPHSSYLRFSVWDEGAKLGDFSIPVKVAHLKEVYFSKKAMFPGMRLNKDLFKNCKVDVLKQHANTVQANANLASFETSSSIRANSPLKWNNLTKVTLINKGKVIDVFASGNGIFCYDERTCLRGWSRRIFCKSKKPFFR